VQTVAEFTERGKAMGEGERVYIIRPYA
jgi:hypothetical protein